MSHPRRATALLLTMSGITALVTLDTTITGVILPSVGRSLHAGFGQLEWIMTGYMLPFAAFLLPAGAWADFRGRRRAALIGLGLFALASLLCGLAPSAGWLVAARVAQGVGAAFLGASIAIIGHSFRGEARLRAFALLGSVIGIATVVGPMAGGLLASWVGWRWAFLVNPPLCLLLAILTLGLAEESRDHSVARFDRLGAALFGLALGLLTYALVGLNSGGLLRGATLAALLGCVLLLRFFLGAERRARNPMIAPALLRAPAFLGAVAGMVGYAATAQILIFYVPTYLQDAFGFSALGAGLRMAPYAVPLFLAPRWAAGLARVHPPRVLMGAGLGLTCLGNAVLALTAPAHAYAAFAVGMAVAGVGGGILNAETAKAFFAAIPPAQSGVASGLGTTTRFAGLLVAIALVGAIAARAGFAAAFLFQAAGAAAAACASFRWLGGAPASASPGHAAGALE
ncbi:MAG TPA: MFS transporter [Opitutaceae bacterium]|nr:MFS transporter [Opitutaceae bacterium]